MARRGARNGKGRAQPDAQEASDGARASATLGLSFRAIDELLRVDKPLVHDLSALGGEGRTLFCAADETATVERLLLNEAGDRFEEHANFPLGEIFDLPDGPDGEMDIEGLSVQDGWLWIAGSHGLKRDGPDGAPKHFGELDDIDWDLNRGFLGRVPLLDRGEGVLEPVARIETLQGGERRAACLPMDKKGRNAVKRMLAKDPVLGPFMAIPCKENGFDIEGLAVAGDRVFLGLRGPVVGGRATLVELRLKQTKAGRLKPRKLADGRRYRLHALDLGGLGIRDLLLDRGRLLILAGVSMDLDGPQAVFALDPLPEAGESFAATPPRRLLELPIRRGVDHAEGMQRIERGGRAELLVVYDSPAPERLDETRQEIAADVFPMV
jgi:hypothetical protein